jgi:hypothetical protein
MVKDNNTNPKKERKIEDAQEATYIRATGEWSVRYPDGYSEKITSPIVSQHPNKRASRSSIAAEDLEQFKLRLQQRNKKPEEEEGK